MLFVISICDFKEVNFDSPQWKPRIQHHNQPTLAIYGSVAPARHRAGEPPHRAPYGQWDGSDCCGHLHWVEEFDQHDVKIQSLVVITAHGEK